MPTYTYSLATNFGGSISTAQLKSEITTNVGITKTLKKIDLDGDNVKIDFETTLTAGEQTTLNNIVAAHNVNKTNASIKGNGYIYATSLAESSTTSVTYVQKMSLTTQYYPAPTNIKIEWYYRRSANTHDKNLQWRVQLDDTTTIHEEYLELGQNETYQRQITSGFWVGQIGVGTHFIDVDFLTTDSGKTVIISDVRLLVTDL